MAAIPTILKGDDTGAISISIATGKTYTGATLVLAYQGVTRKFTNLVAGETRTFNFTHDETAGFSLKTAPVLMRLIGQYGAEETVENADMRIKVTDCLAEVNAGGSFVVQPGGTMVDPTKVPITDVGDMASHYTMADLTNKVNQIIRVLAQRSLLALAVACGVGAAFGGGVEVQTARLDSLFNDAQVVTNATASGLLDLSATNTQTMASVLVATNDIYTARIDPTDVGGISFGFTNGQYMSEVKLTALGLERSSYGADKTYLTLPTDDSGTLATREWVNAHGGTDGAAVTNIVTNVVTKAYVEGLGVSGGGVTTNDVRALADEQIEAAGVVKTNHIGSIKVEGGAEFLGDITIGDYGDVRKLKVTGQGSSISVENSTFEKMEIKGGDVSCYYQGGMDDFDWKIGTGGYGMIGVRLLMEYSPFEGEGYTHSISFPAKSGTVALTSDIPSTNALATKTYVDDANATTRAIVSTWEGFLDGSNVVFSITNYMSGSYSLDAAKFRVLEMTNGIYREVYNSRTEMLMHLGNFETNTIRPQLSALSNSVESAVANKADKDWGKYTSAGGVAPSNTVYMTAPNTVFAGGMEYERVAVGEGAVCVLTTKGAPVWTQGDEGTFKFQDDGGTNYFGFAKTDSYVIGADTDGISVANNIVTLTYNVTMSGVPCVWYKADLSSNTEWEQLNLPDGTAIAGASHVVSWEQTPVAGTEVCYINCQEAKGFFRATIEVAGSAKFMTNMPADLSGGILCTDGIHKVKIEWNGGSPRFVEAQ